MAKKETKPAAKPTTAKPKADPSTEQFKAIVKAYLDKRAEQDELFKATYAKPNKSIDECCAYIIQEVRKANRIGWANSEIWNLAVHYYDEDDIKVASKSMPNVGIVHTNGHDDTPLRPTPKPTPSKGKGAPQKPTTTPPKSTTPPQKAATSKMSESKPSTTANKPQYAASLFDL